MLGPSPATKFIVVHLVLGGVVQRRQGPVQIEIHLGLVMLLDQLHSRCDAIFVDSHCFHDLCRGLGELLPRGQRINAFGQRSLSDMQIARLSLSGVNEKMRCAAHAVRATSARIDSSYLH